MLSSNLISSLTISGEGILLIGNYSSRKWIAVKPPQAKNNRANVTA